MSEHTVQNSTSLTVELKQWCMTVAFHVQIKAASSPRTSHCACVIVTELKNLVLQPQDKRMMSTLLLNKVLHRYLQKFVAYHLSGEASLVQKIEKYIETRTCRRSTTVD